MPAHGTHGSEAHALACQRPEACGVPAAEAGMHCDKRGARRQGRGACTRTHAHICIHTCQGVYLIDTCKGMYLCMQIRRQGRGACIYTHNTRTHTHTHTHAHTHMHTCKCITHVPMHADITHIRMHLPPKTRGLGDAPHQSQGHTRSVPSSQPAPSWTQPAPHRASPAARQQKTTPAPRRALPRAGRENRQTPAPHACTISARGVAHT